MRGETRPLGEYLGTPGLGGLLLNVARVKLYSFSQRHTLQPNRAGSSSSRTTRRSQGEELGRLTCLLAA